MRASAGISITTSSEAPDAMASWREWLAVVESAESAARSVWRAASWDAVSASAPQAFASFVQTLVQRGRKPIVVAFGNPYLLQQLPSIGAYLVAWGGFPVSQTAAAQALLGSSPISGHLPITIPPYATRGTGIERSPVSK